MQGICERRSQSRCFSLVHRSLSLALIVAIALLASILVPTTEAFLVLSRTSTGSTRLHIQPIDTAKEEGLTLDPIPTGDDGNEWSAMSSFGAALLQLRKEEEEIMLEIGDEGEDEIEERQLTRTPIRSEIRPEIRELMPMDVGTATDLDNAVVRITVDEFKEDMTVLPMVSPQVAPQYGTIDISDMPLSQPEHYSERIDRDKRLLAIGIAESVDEPWQWRRFCDEKGGIKSLLKTIQNGANYFVKNDQQGSEFLLLLEEYEETFLAACNACRALRDLCAISDDVRAVMTDEILRANAASGNNALMKDFSSLLRHADEADVWDNVRLKNFRPKSNFFRLLGRKDRRGELFCRCF